MFLSLLPRRQVFTTDILLSVVSGITPTHGQKGNVSLILPGRQMTYTFQQMLLNQREISINIPVICQEEKSEHRPCSALSILHRRWHFCNGSALRFINPSLTAPQYTSKGRYSQALSISSEVVFSCHISHHDKY